MNPAVGESKSAVERLASATIDLSLRRVLPLLAERFDVPVYHLHDEFVLAAGDQLAEHARRHFFIEESARTAVAFERLVRSDGLDRLGAQVLRP